MYHGVYSIDRIILIIIIIIIIIVIFFIVIFRVLVGRLRIISYVFFFEVVRFYGGVGWLLVRFLCSSGCCVIHSTSELFIPG